MSTLPHEECIEVCLACALACERCAASCLNEEDVTAMASCIALDRDCAEICLLAASWMARDSTQAAALCALCAEVCDACGSECSQHEMAHCQTCAVACERCADACRGMSEDMAQAA